MAEDLGKSKVTKQNNMLDGMILVLGMTWVVLQSVRAAYQVKVEDWFSTTCCAVV